MYFSQLFTKTSKEASSDAGSINANLLTRAGFIHKTMAGAYAMLPLGLKVLQKIENIVREEMDKIGAEILMNAISPRAGWEKTGRDQVDSAFEVQGANEKSRKQNDASYMLSFSHEELVTPLIQSFCSSYKDLPCAAYQIQTKFRNEPRPKSGLLRGREFRMKDLYSFHASEEDLLDYFMNKAIPAYKRVFQRVGLGEKTVIALASGGIFSKEPSREFQTICPQGEDLIFKAADGTYYNKEIAPCRAPAWNNSAEKLKPKEDVLGKGIIGVEELAKFLKIETERTTKAILFKTDNDRLVLACVRGGYDVNQEKLCRVTGCNAVELADEKTVEKITGAKVGYAGPIGLPENVSIFWDESCRGRVNFECGANQTNYHSINVNFGRDIEEPTEFFDIKTAREGDLDPQNNRPYETFKASEVGNVFTLYRKYTDAFGFTYTARDGSQKPVYMGCYGIGTTRIVGVLAEVCNDEKGLIWPETVAPAQYHIIPVARDKKEESYKAAEDLYKKLSNHGKECLFDDRLEISVGARLADADLIGVPVRIVVSKKTLEQGGVEVKARSTGEQKVVRTEAIR